ncbi:RING finger protein 208-like [Phyllopteryx taeniolatus]|uniref:RING finger protein 208-like n=1 Tax=Phyllopteryx taeniolatus TaxID=161469 RepID=UPI002AD430E8|nr:RING finger protein 208-like [Phyllopteryx taeniolatus]XP_061640755.1 RING finger protein 208-like [Phyllopteryx taeniolatus]
MSTNEELECVVCCHEYSHSQRVPRLLHCSHTFCVPCLEKLANVDTDIQTICCPLCRRITTFQARLALPEALWVNTEIWDHIPKKEQKKRTEESVEDLNKKLFRPMLSNSNHTAFKSRLHKVFNCFLLEEGQFWSDSIVVI